MYGVKGKALKWFESYMEFTKIRGIEFVSILNDIGMDCLAIYYIP